MDGHRPIQLRFTRPPLVPRTVAKPTFPGLWRYGSFWCGRAPPAAIVRRIFDDPQPHTGALRPVHPHCPLRRACRGSGGRHCRCIRAGPGPEGPGSAEDQPVEELPAACGRSQQGDRSCQDPRRCRCREERAHHRPDRAATGPRRGPSSGSSRVRCCAGGAGQHGRAGEGAGRWCLCRSDECRR